MSRSTRKITVKEANSIYERLVPIHRVVTNNFTYKSDREVFGVDEYWDFPEALYDGTSPVVGDCDDFAIACRKLIRDAGMDSRLVFCQVETGEYHLVCECHGWILDNRYPSGVIPNSHPFFNGYKWLRISGYEPGDPWSEVSLKR